MRPLSLSFFLLTSAISCLAAEPPRIVGPSPENEACIVRLPDDSLKVFFIERPSETALRSIRSTDGGLTWGDDRRELALPGSAYHAIQVQCDRKGTLHLFTHIRRGPGHNRGVDYFYDIYYARSGGDRTAWSEPCRIYEGYVGALRGVVQLSSGRIVLPFEYAVPGRPSAPPTGSFACTVLYSDDDGETWELSDCELTAPCYAGFVGENYGLTEPCILQLDDGRAWSLFRTQTGFLYESFSEDGAKWEAPTPTPFISTTSPAETVRLPDGRIVIFWNHCRSMPPVDNAADYVNRDALHAAVSRDGGKTWLGYREVFRNPAGCETPGKRDRGTAYPDACVNKDGRIVLVTGQNPACRGLVLIDPDWLEETSHEDDFSAGLGNWSVFTPFGRASNWWRDRTQGAVLAVHPDDVSKSVLHVRRAEEKPGDGAVWNFPASRRGILELKLRLNEGFAGGRISLADCFMFPTDTEGDAGHALAGLDIGGDGRINETAILQPGKWHSLSLRWNLDESPECRLVLDGQSIGTIPIRTADTAGASYLRLRSTAPEPDPHGFFVECVSFRQCE